MSRAARASWLGYVAGLCPLYASSCFHCLLACSPGLRRRQRRRCTRSVLVRDRHWVAAGVQMRVSMRWALVGIQSSSSSCSQNSEARPALARGDSLEELQHSSMAAEEHADSEVVFVDRHLLVLMAGRTQSRGKALQARKAAQSEWTTVEQGHGIGEERRKGCRTTR